MGNISPISSKLNEDGSYNPSTLTRFMGTSKKTPYSKQEYEETYRGTKPILVICTDEHLLEMKNGKKFSTGNHPVEMLVPMLHFRDAGFKFDIATLTGAPVKLEMWAYPEKDENVQNLYDEIEDLMENPKKISDISSLDDYSAIFLPGGHGCIINLPFCGELGKLLHMAHEASMPTISLCHGPATLLSTAVDGMEFAYEGYEIHVFSDWTDAKVLPNVGYMPGHMPWKVQAKLEEKGAKVMNTSETGACIQDRELITGDSPNASHNLGVMAAPIVVKYANEHKL